MHSLFLRRILAYLVDCALLFLVLAPLGIAVQSGIGVSPETTHGIYVTLLLNFSVPGWGYFTWGDCSARGATCGKRLLDIRVETGDGRYVETGRALGRTAIKMLPWEISHASAFLLAPTVGIFGLTSWTGLAAAYVLVFAYLGVAWWTGGQKSVHDFATATVVRTESHRAENIG